MNINHFRKIIDLTVQNLGKDGPYELCVQLRGGVTLQGPWEGIGNPHGPLIAMDVAMDKGQSRRVYFDVEDLMAVAVLPILS